MTFDPLAPVPLLTADLPGTGGRIKCRPEDFEVEEIPAYQPSGAGEFLYLWVEKRGLGAEFFLRQIARRLDISAQEVGTAGLKDRHAVTRQMVSVPARAEPRLPQLDGDGIRVLGLSRHTNKLKPGHLRGNRFRVVVRGVDPDSAARLPPLLDSLRTEGLPNFYGPQRFGREGETVRLGLALLAGASEPEARQRAGLTRRLTPFLRKLALSAAQSALFNHTLARRLTDGLLHTVLPGDVMAKWPFGGMFVTDDVAREQARFDAREVVPTGPMFGRKMMAPAHEAARREEEALGDAGLRVASFHGFGKLLAGTRRHNLVYVDDLAGSVAGEEIELRFTLPAGSYATVLLREVTRSEAADADEPG
jgi:tRNA pseudouridine13 synthase